MLILFYFIFLEKRLVLTIDPDDYITNLGAGSTIRLYVKGTVTETGQSFAAQRVVELEKPQLTVKVSRCHQNTTILANIFETAPYFGPFQTPQVCLSSPSCQVSQALSFRVVVLGECYSLVLTSQTTLSNCTTELTLLIKRITLISHPLMGIFSCIFGNPT